MSHPFSKPPSGTHKSPTSFRISIPDARLEELQAMIKLSKIAAPTYETIQKDRWYGVTREWLLNAKEEWLRYNWSVRTTICTLDAEYISPDTNFIVQAGEGGQNQWLPSFHHPSRCQRSGV